MVRRRVEGRGGGGEAASAAAGRVGAAVDQVRLHVEGQKAGAGLEGSLRNTIITRIRIQSSRLHESNLATCQYFLTLADLSAPPPLTIKQILVRLRLGVRMLNDLVGMTERL